MVYAYPSNSMIGVVFREVLSDHPRVFRERTINGRRFWEYFYASEFEEIELYGARMGTFDGLLMPRSHVWDGSIEFVAKPQD